MTEPDERIEFVLTRGIRPVVTRAHRTPGPQFLAGQDGHVKLWMVKPACLVDPSGEPLRREWAASPQEA